MFSPKIIEWTPFLCEKFIKIPSLSWPNIDATQSEDSKLVASLKHFFIKKKHCTGAIPILFQNGGVYLSTEESGEVCKVNGTATRNLQPSMLPSHL